MQGETVPAGGGCTCRGRLLLQGEAAPARGGCTCRGRLFLQGEAAPPGGGCSSRGRLLLQGEAGRAAVYSLAQVGMQVVMSTEDAFPYPRPVDDALYPPLSPDTFAWGRAESSHQTRASQILQTNAAEPIRSCREMVFANQLMYCASTRCVF